ncbi:TetR/AcrR family transcriptional regulator [Pontivivens ytuae]|uniref:TetR/AcrR family transcriptional regulator n=1 Tax=Pontivivens ytuae TaxID=2789856 RepID=A0A7S9QBC7_9RHOB|nr:TetR/AcrR family transcriptional regulator [Pontivivens ytuae]QPH53058.1 TetR/AcrR family transcriptional regulator [Pontivivens ytuae]
MANAAAPSTQSQPTRKGRKYEQVLDGARLIFLEQGFEGASVDDIARAAGVSKATLYSYFPDKRLLFSEVIAEECRRQAEATFSPSRADGPSEEVLTRIARDFVRFLDTDIALQVFRTCVGEVTRFPELARRFYESGPGLMMDSLIEVLKAGIARGELAIDDPELAAGQFAELCHAKHFLPRILGLEAAVPVTELDRIADEAVRTFLSRYGT